jgi:ubiquinone/menaquinone biosynthesis C-methylase UbiE
MRISLAAGKVMKRVLKSFIRFLLPIGLVLIVNHMLRALTAAAHKLQFQLQWRVASRQPGWFDHFINQYCWHEMRDASPWDRGVLGLLGMKPGCRILDLCCGDGFYPYHFYSGRAARIVAVDYDPEGIRFAKRHFKAANLEFRRCDIRVDLPEHEFDNVTWDAGIDYFTLPETELILTGLKRRLTPEGILSGVAPKWPKGYLGHVDQKNEFASAQELGDVLRRFFRNVAVMELGGASPTGRTTFYFYASDGPIPLDANSGTYLRLP